MRITKDTKLSELLGNPKAVEILAKHNVPCLGCPFAQFELDKLKLGDICKMYKIKINPLLTELSRIENKRK